MCYLEKFANNMEMQNESTGQSNFSSATILNIGPTYLFSFSELSNRLHMDCRTLSLRTLKLASVIRQFSS